jgi:hypothetical protein
MLIVAGFIALLNVAVTSAVFGQKRVEPAGGVTAVTVGAVWGAAGSAAFGFRLGLQHPVAKPTNRSARNKILWLLCIRMPALFFSAQSPTYHIPNAGF